MMNLASRLFLSRAAAESALYQTYERQRRERLLRGCCRGKRPSSCW